MIDSKQALHGHAHRAALQRELLLGHARADADHRRRAQFEYGAAGSQLCATDRQAIQHSEWVARHGGRPPPAKIETRAWFNPNLESRWFFMPGIVGLLTLLVTMLVTALSVAREREQGTFDQLLVTPLRPGKSCWAKPCPASSSALPKPR